MKSSVLDPFITNPGFRVDVLRSFVIGPPPVDLRTLEGSVNNVQDKPYKVSTVDGTYSSCPLATH
jgi:hypothetical protein